MGTMVRQPQKVPISKQNKKAGISVYKSVTIVDSMRNGTGALRGPLGVMICGGNQKADSSAALRNDK